MPPGRFLTADRLALHAFTIYFQHPATQQKLTLTAPYPAEFEALRLALGSGQQDAT